MYGFAPSHVEYGTNDYFCAQILSWAGGRSVPTLVMGDNNLQTHEPNALQHSEQLGMHRISGVGPATKGRQPWP